MDAVALGVLSGVEADHGGAGHEVQPGGGLGGRQLLGGVGQSGEDHGVAHGQDRQPGGLNGGGGQQGCVIRARACRGDQFLDPGDVSGEHGRRGGFDQQPGTVLALRCEFRGALQGLGCRRVAAAAAGPAGGPLQLRRRGRVRVRAGGGKMPGTPVRFVPQHLGEREVSLALGAQGRGVIHGGPDQWVAEPDVPAGPPDQPGLPGRQPGRVLGARQPRRDGDRGVGAVHGGQEQQSPHGGGGETVQASGEDPLQVIGERKRTCRRQRRGRVLC